MADPSALRQLAVQPPRDGLAWLDGDLDRAWFAAHFPGSGDELASSYQRWMPILSRHRRSLICCHSLPDSGRPLGFLLAAFANRHPLWFAPSAPAQRKNSITRFCPELVYDGARDVLDDGYPDADALVPGSPLAVLLETSGSSGTPRTVALSWAGLNANAAAIALALRIRPAERSALSVPVSHAFGLSILNSVLAAGGAVLPPRGPLTDERVATALTAAGVGTIACVPHTVRALVERGLHRRLTSVRTLLLAGGSLGLGATDRTTALLAREGIELVRMYGQTEATARITVLDPSESSLVSEDCVGRPVVGVQVWIEHEDTRQGLPDDAVGEVCCSGRSAMLGYVATRRDLTTLSESPADTVRTGDRGRLSDGRLHLAGRISRDVKVWGSRVNLDEVSTLASRDCGARTYAIAFGSIIVLVVAKDMDRAKSRSIATEIAAAVGLPRGAVRILPGTNMPLTERGKPDFGRAGELVAARFG